MAKRKILKSIVGFIGGAFIGVLAFLYIIFPLLLGSTDMSLGPVLVISILAGNIGVPASFIIGGIIGLILARKYWR